MSELPFPVDKLSEAQKKSYEEILKSLNGLSYNDVVVLLEAIQINVRVISLVTL
jgi:hypothetical protein